MKLSSFNKTFLFVKKMQSFLHKINQIQTRVVTVDNEVYFPKTALGFLFLSIIGWLVSLLTIFVGIIILMLTPEFFKLLFLSISFLLGILYVFFDVPIFEYIFNLCSLI